jgi:hypothetical protein
MARFYYAGMEPREDKNIGGVVGGGIERGPDPDRPNILPVPFMWRSMYGASVPLKKGGIAAGFVGWGWFHIGPGEYVDLPDSIPTRTVKTKCPQLLTKEEAMEIGMANEDGSLRKVPSKDKSTEVRK